MTLKNKSYDRTTSISKIRRIVGRTFFRYRMEDVSCTARKLIIYSVGLSIENSHQSNCLLKRGPFSGSKTATSQNSRHCRNCDGAFPHQSKFPVFGMKCHYCHKPNHFLSVCRKRIKSSRLRQTLREISGHYSDIKSRGSDIEVSFGLKTQINYVSGKFLKLNLKVNGISINAPNDTD